MKVLWFEVKVPQNYSSHNFHGAGWQDALEQIVKSQSDIELGIAFESKNDVDKIKVIDGVHYFPMRPKYSFIEKFIDKFSWKMSRDKLIPISLKVIKEFKPDIIHVFGSEWCFGQVAEFSDVPVIIHLQGSIPPYNNAFYPPGYNEWIELIYNFVHFKLKMLVLLPLSWIKRKTWKAQEERTLKFVKNYMGRTTWDKGIVNLYHPNANYFYCSEALRTSFVDNVKEWQQTTGNNKLRLTTTGCSSFWKGLDTIVRTAKLLKERNIDFEWRLAGEIGNKELIEWKEKTRMVDVNIRLLGMLNADDLLKLLMNTDIYVHAAYIDNSPNSICEAQYLGLPVIATYVGGIPSLIIQGETGIMVPANDPYTMAVNIINLSEKKDYALLLGKNARKIALLRHNPQRILGDLLTIYKHIIEI